MSMRTDSSFGYITPPERLWNHPWYPAMTRPSYVGYTGLPAWRRPLDGRTSVETESAGSGTFHAAPPIATVALRAGPALPNATTTEPSGLTNASQSPSAVLSLRAPCFT